MGVKEEKTAGRSNNALQLLSQASLPLRRSEGSERTLFTERITQFLRRAVDTKEASSCDSRRCDAPDAPRADEL